SHLLYKLTETEDSIRALYRTDSKLETVKHIFSYYSEDFEERFNKIEWYKADITDLPKLIDAFNGITYVYHCAALVSFDPNDYYTLRHVNIDGTANIVNLCLSHNVKKLCYVSSIAAVGLSTDDSLTKESSEWNKEEDHNVYAITKYGAEMEVWRGTQEGLDAVIVNPGVIVGPGFWNASSSSLFKQIHKGLKYYTKGITGYIDIFDVVDIMIKLYQSDFKNERYILIAENISFKTFITKVAEKLKVKPPKKEASLLLLKIAWRIDWLRQLITSKKRKLTKHLVTSLTCTRKYSNKKISDALDYKFKPIDVSISEVCQFYLEDLKNPS
ncbi:MAG: NAD-dependent epimerase/dehydratase family protein, partial [Bacteroidia bacterium]|nr:NAD-dependent epimerase/dehydratase family protein [Bacteroidia bacterium]